MADKILTFRIPSAKLAVALQGFLAIYPNDETIPDPAWVDLEDETEVPQIAKFTNSQWVTEQIRRLIVRDIHRGLQKLAMEAVNVALDDTIAETQ